MEFDITVYGLTYMQQDYLAHDTRAFEHRMQTFINPDPTGEGDLDVRLQNMSYDQIVFVLELLKVHEIHGSCVLIIYTDKETRCVSGRYDGLTTEVESLELSHRLDTLAL